MPRAEGVVAPHCIVCGKVATRKDIDGYWWPPCGHMAVGGIGTLRFSDEPVPAADPLKAWRLTKGEVDLQRAIVHSQIRTRLAICVLSLRQVALRAGLSPAALSGVKAGNLWLSLDAAERVLDVLSGAPITEDA